MMKQKQFVKINQWRNIKQMMKHIKEQCNFGWSDGQSGIISYSKGV